MTATFDSTSGRIAYETAGSPGAPLLLMLHGWFCYRGVWRSTMRALQDRFYCVAVDPPGFGDSDRPADADYGIEAQGRRILQLAGALGARGTARAAGRVWPFPDVREA